MAATVFALATVSAQADTTECQHAAITHPAQDQTLTNSRPEIRWEPTEGADRYRVRMRSRIPEGEVLVTIDTLVRGERFLPPRSLTDFRAIVRIVVSSGCGNEAPRVEEGTRFFVDTAPLCVLEGVELIESDATVITWKPVPKAIEYETWFYEMPDSFLAEKRIMRDTQVSIPDKVKRPAVAAIRPRCATGYGESRLIDLK